MMLKVQLGNDPRTFRIFNSSVPETETTLAHLQAFCLSEFNIPVYRQQFHEIGRGVAVIGEVISPPGGIVSDSTALVELGIRALDRIAVVEHLDNPSPSPQVASSPNELSASGVSSSAARSSDTVPSVQARGHGKYCPVVKMERRTVAADNSCLFECIAQTVFGGQASATDMRQLCINAVRSVPEVFSAAVLGFPSVDSYVEWLSQPTNWGGYVELSALALELHVCFVAIEVQNCRAEIYGPEYKNEKAVYLIYDGIHYDYIVGVDREGKAWRTFPTHNDTYFGQAVAICEELRQRKEFTNLNEAAYRCQQCDTMLASTTDLQTHANRTGHYNFVQLDSPQQSPS